MTTEKNMRLDFSKVASFLIIFVILTCILIVGKDVLVPVTFGILLAFMLRPVCNFYENASGNRVVGILLTLITFLVPLIAAGWFFIARLQLVLNEMDDIMSGLQEGVDELTSKLGAVFKMNRRETSKFISDGIENVFAEPFDHISSGLMSSTSVVVDVLLTLIYMFFFLLYRTSIKRFIMQQFRRRERDGGQGVIYSIQSVSKKYFGGMFTVMAILGVLNSIGLYFIGIDFPFLWGFLAATLAVIPYIGTLMGGALPFLYSFASGDGYWQPIQILILYTVIQSLEGNFITPKIVGKSVNINPLAAIFALLVGEAIWGIPGMVVALPLLAIVKIIMDHIDGWKPVGLLLSDDFYTKSELYQTRYDSNRYRLISIFFRLEELPANPAQGVSNPDTQVITDPETK